MASSNCVFAAQEIISHVNAGGFPYPIFFAFPKCGQPGEPLINAWRSTVTTTSQYDQFDKFRYRFPLVGDIIADSEIEPNHTFQGSTVCLQNGKTGRFSHNACPTPVIRSMLIPDGLEVEFNTQDPTLVPSPPLPGLPFLSAPSARRALIRDHLAEPGMFIVDDSVLKNNMLEIPWSVSTDPAPLKWGSASNNGGACDLDNRVLYTDTQNPPSLLDKNADGTTTYYVRPVNGGPLQESKADPPDKKTSDDSTYPITAHQGDMSLNLDGKQKYSIASCGAPFFPSFMATETVGRNNLSRSCTNSDFSTNQIFNHIDFNSKCRPGFWDTPRLPLQGFDTDTTWIPAVDNSFEIAEGIFTYNYIHNPWMAIFSGNKTNHDQNYSRVAGAQSTYTPGVMQNAVSLIRLGTRVSSGAVERQREMMVTTEGITSSLINVGAATDCLYSNSPNATNKFTSPYLAQDCPENQRLRGSVGSFRVYTKRNKLLQRARWCTKVDIFKVGGITASVFDNGTAECDAVMKQFCASPDAQHMVAADDDNDFSFTTACSCILKQQQLEAEFKNIDLPISCFQNGCAQVSQHTYELSNQTRPCSARLCQQAISVHGSDIGISGFQNLQCNAQVFNVDTNTTQPTTFSPVNIISPTDNPENDGLPKLRLTPSFYMSLSLLGVLIILVILFIVRRVRKQRAAQQSENASTLKWLLNRNETKSK